MNRLWKIIRSTGVEKMKGIYTEKSIFLSISPRFICFFESISFSLSHSLHFSLSFLYRTVYSFHLFENRANNEIDLNSKQLYCHGYWMVPRSEWGREVPTKRVSKLKRSVQRIGEA